VQYSDSRGTGSTGTETVLLNIEVIAVLCLDIVDFSFNLAVECQKEIESRHDARSTKGCSAWCGLPPWHTGAARKPTRYQ